MVRYGLGIIWWRFLLQSSSRAEQRTGVLAMLMLQLLSDNKKRKAVILIVNPGLHLPSRKATTAVLEGEAQLNYPINHVIKTLCEQGHLRDALRILQMKSNSVQSSTYVYLLQGCIKKKALSDGKLVHAHINCRGLRVTIYLQNTIVNMYAKCGNLADSRRAFNQMPERDAFSWTVMIAAYVKHGSAEEALALFHLMRRTGFEPDEFILASVLPACSSLSVLRDVHKDITRGGFQYDVFVGSALVDMYAKCGSIEDARHVFDGMTQRDVAVWNAMIGAYARQRLSRDALELFCQMLARGIQPNEFTCASVLPACANLGALEHGMEIHGCITRNEIRCDGFVANALIDMYTKCRCVETARNLFDKMHKRDVVSWTVMIAGYAHNGQGEEALKFFRQMQQAGVKPNLMTFTSVLSACALLGDVEQGMEFHEEIARSGFQSDVFVESALVDMYAKCGRLKKARDIFEKMPQRNSVSWTAMIAGYAQNGHIDEAHKLFQVMPNPDVFAWTAMIVGYTQTGQSAEALELYEQMQLAGVMPEPKTFASVLPACANLAAVDQGMRIHEEIIQRGFQSDTFIVNALIDMYAKCGNVERARELFDKMHKKDVISWTAMIAGYAIHGFAKEALILFQKMQHFGTNPNHITLVCVLSACCHAGLVDEGRRYFNCMSEYYHITPSLEHYSCMVDLLGRAGRLDEAQDFINKMPIKPDATVWACLLAACRLHNNAELGEFVAERLFELDPENASPYVLLSNIYAAIGKWGSLQNVRKMMKERRVKKAPGCSWIEINKQVHSFVVGN